VAVTANDRDCVKTLWCHFHHVNFGHVREIARDFSASSCLLGHLRGGHFRFSHSLGPKLPIKLPKSNGMDAPTLLIGIVVLKSGHLGSELPARAPGGILSQRLQDQEGEDGGGVAQPASTPTRAVFLSYASQDADAARWICAGEHPVSVIVQDSAAQTVLELLRRWGT